MAVGGALGVLLLHPATMVIYWLEHAPDTAGLGPAWRFALDSLLAAFEPGMLAMTGRFAAFGTALGLFSGLFTMAARRHERQVERLARLLDRDLATLIRQGEGQSLELKASIRWDYRNGCVHRELEAPIVRSIAGFLNGGGGTLLIGVADSGARRLLVLRTRGFARSLPTPEVAAARLLGIFSGDRGTSPQAGDSVAAPSRGAFGP